MKLESIHPNSWHHSRKKQKDSLETQVLYVDIEAVLANFCCYDYGAKASEAVQKISTRTLELYANSLRRLILYHLLNIGLM